MAKSTFKDIINNEIPVIVDFYADWCGPCKMQSPILNQLKNDLGNDIKIVKIDVDKNQDLSKKMGIRSIPTMHIYHKGELKWQKSGIAQLTDFKREIQLIEK